MNLGDGECELAHAPGGESIGRDAFRRGVDRLAVAKFAPNGGPITSGQAPPRHDPPVVQAS